MQILGIISLAARFGLARRSWSLLWPA